MTKDGKSFVGKVRANAVGTFFTVYDNGCNPKKAENLGDGLRQELAAIIYVGLINCKSDLWLTLGEECFRLEWS